MDSNIVSGTGTGIDAFAMVEFGSNPPLRTRVRTSKGKGNLRVAFNEALYLPVWVPTMTNRIAISVWDQDPGALAPPPPPLSEGIPGKPGTCIYASNYPFLGFPGICCGK